MEDYKVAYENKKGYHVTDWTTKQKALRKFNSLKNEKEINTIYAELIYSSIDDNTEDEVVVIDSFERKVVSILGSKIII